MNWSWLPYQSYINVFVCVCVDMHRRNMSNKVNYKSTNAAQQLVFLLIKEKI